MKTKLFKFFLLVLSSIIIVGCSNEEELLVVTPVDDGEAIKVVTISNKLRSTSSDGEPETVLWFKDMQTFAAVANELVSLPLEDQLKWADNYAGYKSIYNYYQTAMREAENLSFTETEYKNFKGKHAKNLYFPEYNDDYGAYIPYANGTSTMLLNANGRYMIGDQIYEAERITTYEQLQQTGQAMDIPIIVAPPSTFDPRFPALPRTLPAYAYSLAISGGWWFNKIKIGDDVNEFVMNWKEVGNGKKIRVTFGRILTNRWSNIQLCLWHSEVSFRKKGFLGKWYNYNSQTSFKATITEDGRNPIRLSFSADGGSSHDGYWRAYYQPISLQDVDGVYNMYTKSKITSSDLRLYNFPKYKVDMQVTFRGMTETLYLSDNKDRIYGYTTSRNPAFE